jgi:hypothetical protein
LLYTAYIAMIFTVVRPEQRNMMTLSHMVTLSDVMEDNPFYQNAMDVLFEAVDKILHGGYDPGRTAAVGRAQVHPAHPGGEAFLFHEI